MTNKDTTPTGGAADLPEALKHAEGLESFAEHLPAYGFDSKQLKEAAATIRRLHALLEAEDAAHCNTIEQRDEAEKLGAMLANAVAEHFRVEVGEYSNLNDPRIVALEILDGGYITDSDADRKIAALAAGQATAAQQGAARADSVQEDALSDALRVPLDSLHADADYLIGRLRDGSMPYVRVIEIIRERIDAAKAAIRARAAHGQAPAGAGNSVSAQTDSVQEDAAQRKSHAD